MGAVVLVMGAEWRRRWRSWLLLVLLTSLAGGAVLAAAAAGRRTASAYPSFLATHGFDAAVYTGARTWPSTLKPAEVTSVKVLMAPDTGQPWCRCAHPIDPVDFGVLFAPGGDGALSKLVSGRWPDPAARDQVLASFTLQQDYGVKVGAVVRVPFYSFGQASAYNDAVGAPPPPDGPVVAFHVVGIEATEFEFPSGVAPSYDLYTTPAFARTVLPGTAVGYVYAVRLRQGAQDLARFEDQARVLGASASGEDLAAASVEASVHPQAIGWWALAGLAALVGLAVLGQALSRQSTIESEEYPTIAALGADRRHLLAFGLARDLVISLLGGAGAVGLAVALSPLAPLGEARVAEVHTGVRLDPVILVPGALVTVVVVFALGVWPATRAARCLPAARRALAPRTSVLAEHLAHMGAPPSALIGVRHAFERARGDANVPVGPALLGTIFAVIALCGTVVFGASLSHLTSTPKLFGDAFQLNFTDLNGAGPAAALVKQLESDPAVSGITKGLAVEVAVDKVAVGAVAGASVRGALLLSSVAGHLPDGPGQIGLGASTMRRVGAHLGSVVRVTVPAPSGGPRTAMFRVVSQISFPVLGGAVSLGTGAALTIPGYEQAACPIGPGQAVCRRELLSGPISGGLLVSVVPGRRGQAAINHYLGAFGSIAALPVTPTSLVNFGEAVNFPLIFGGILAVSGAATLVHLLVLSVSRRRREVGLLKALGFVSSQIVAIVAWQATAIALVGIVVGVPLGTVLGRTVWDAFANNLGTVPVPIVPVALLAVIVLGILVAANLLAVAPALAARRSRPQQLLRAR